MLVVGAKVPEHKPKPSQGCCELGIVGCGQLLPELRAGARLEEEQLGKVSARAQDTGVGAVK